MVQEQHLKTNMPYTAKYKSRLRDVQLKMLSLLEVIDAICMRHRLDYWLDGNSVLGAVRYEGFTPSDNGIGISMPRASYEKFLQIAPPELPASMWLQTSQTDPGYFNLTAPLKIRSLDKPQEQETQPYQQEIFINVCVVDRLPASEIKRKYYKLLAKKILRTLGPKINPMAVGHHAAFYQIIGRFVPKKMLEKSLQNIIRNANKSDSFYLGCGYDSIKSNLVSYDDIYPLKRVRFETGEFNIANRAETILTELYGDYMAYPVTRLE